MAQKIISNHKPIQPSDSDWSPVSAKNIVRVVQVLNAFTVQGSANGEGDVQTGQAGDYLAQTDDGEYIVVPRSCCMHLFAILQGA